MRPDAPDPRSRLRDAVEAWEREVAAHWDAVIRSPAVLRRAGQQLSLALTSQQQFQQTLRGAVVSAATSQEDTARALYLLERLEAQVDALAERVARLEAVCGDHQGTEHADE